MKLSLTSIARAQIHAQDLDNVFNEWHSRLLDMALTAQALIDVRIGGQPWARLRRTLRRHVQAAPQILHSLGASLPPVAVRAATVVLAVQIYAALCLVSAKIYELAVRLLFLADYDEPLSCRFMAVSRRGSWPLFLVHDTAFSMRPQAFERSSRFPLFRLSTLR